jgi:hypothetical protein
MAKQFQRGRFFRNFSATTERKSINFTGMLSTMSRCADYFWNFQNGHRGHGNGQKKKFKLLQKLEAQWAEPVSLTFHSAFEET